MKLGLKGHHKKRKTEVSIEIIIDMRHVIYIVQCTWYKPIPTCIASLHRHWNCRLNVASKDVCVCGYLLVMASHSSQTMGAAGMSGRRRLKSVWDTSMHTEWPASPRTMNKGQWTMGAGLDIPHCHFTQILFLASKPCFEQMGWTFFV
jgi:hypothetical protein